MIKTFLFLFVMIVTVVAQDNVSGSASDISVIRVYFFLLVFATIINRMLEFLKIAFLNIDSRWPVFSKSGQKVWQKIKTKLDQIGLNYNESKLRERVIELNIAVVLHALGFLFGAIICIILKVGVLDDLGFSLGSDTLNYLVTGFIAGAGVDPVHSFFRLLDEKKKLKKLLSRLS